MRVDDDGRRWEMNNDDAVFLIFCKDFFAKSYFCLEPEVTCQWRRIFGRRTDHTNTQNPKRFPRPIQGRLWRFRSSIFLGLLFVCDRREWPVIWSWRIFPSKINRKSQRCAVSTVSLLFVVCSQAWRWKQSTSKEHKESPYPKQIVINTHKLT